MNQWTQLSLTRREVAISYGTAQKIEAWFRAHRDFGSGAQSQVPVAPSSVADELIKLAQLRDSGVLTLDEFEAQKSKLLA